MDPIDSPTNTGRPLGSAPPRSNNRPNTAAVVVIPAPKKRATRGRPPSSSKTSGARPPSSSASSSSSSSSRSGGTSTVPSLADLAAGKYMPITSRYAVRPESSHAAVNSKLIHPKNELLGNNVMDEDEHPLPHNQNDMEDDQYERRPSLYDDAGLDENLTELLSGVTLIRQKDRHSTEQFNPNDLESEELKYFTQYETHSVNFFVGKTKYPRRGRGACTKCARTGWDNPPWMYPRGRWLPNEKCFEQVGGNFCKPDCVVEYIAVFHVFEKNTLFVNFYAFASQVLKLNVTRLCGGVSNLRLTRFNGTITDDEASIPFAWIGSFEEIDDARWLPSILITKIDEYNSAIAKRGKEIIKQHRPQWSEDHVTRVLDESLPQHASIPDEDLGLVWDEGSNSLLNAHVLPFTLSKKTSNGNNQIVGVVPKPFRVAFSNSLFALPTYGETNPLYNFDHTGNNQVIDLTENGGPEEEEEEEEEEPSPSSRLLSTGVEDMLEFAHSSSM